MAKQAGMRRERGKDSAPLSLKVADLITRSPLSLPAKRLLRTTIRRLEADVKSVQARHAIALARISEAEAKRASLAAELDRAREIYTATRAALDEAGASRAAMIAACADLQHSLDEACVARDAAIADAASLREAMTADAVTPTAPADTVPGTPTAPAAFAPAEPFRHPSATDAARRVAAEQPAPLRPTPRVPESTQAAVGRGRVNVTTSVGQLLLRAPKDPGGHAGRCFAELLDRAAGQLMAPPLDDDDGSARGDFEGRRDWGAKDDLGALATLYRVETGFYRNAALRPSDGLPLNGDVMRFAAMLQHGSSPAAACIEAAHG